MIFISGRFRSGTTALWNIFKGIPQTCSYIEPLHDNLLAYVNANIPPDHSHKGVSDYWDEYRPIQPELGKYHRREFGVTRLCLASNDQYPELKTYLEFLAGKAGSRIPVFKFVRADYRLPWLKNTFPKAKIISIRRNPRNNWLSIISKSSTDALTNPWLNTGYDLSIWSANLAEHFGFIGSNIGHSYGRSYCLWKISTAVANKYADLIIDYDLELIRDPRETISRLFEVCDITDPSFEQTLAKVAKEPTRDWGDWSDRVPFDELEKLCDYELNKSGILDFIASGGLDNASWPLGHSEKFPRELINSLCLEISTIRDCQASLFALNKELEEERTKWKAQQSTLNVMSALEETKESHVITRIRKLLMLIK